MGDDITIGVTEIVNNIEVTAQPNDQVVDISVVDNADDVTLNITPTVIEININKGSSYAKWGDILGTLSDQTDLQSALDLKANLVGGKVPASELPSYVDDVVEVANYAALPATGETGKIYVTLDNNKIYRWSGSVYIEIAANSAIWGAITGTLSSQTDLVNALNAKFDNPTGNTTQYIAGDGSLITFPVAGQAGTLVREVRNTTGSTLTKGTIVYINGATGNKPTVAKAIATGDSTSAQTFGMLQADLANNANGYVVCVGDIVGLDTSAITEGTQLYLSSTTAGAYTTTKQVAPAHLVYIGVVTRSHPTQGQIEVKIQNGYELDEIHDVLITSKSNNQFLVYESASSLWKNKSLGTVLAGTSSQFLKGDGSLDSNTYALTSQLHDAVTIGTANGLSLSTQVLSLGLASGSANGALSSTDWTTFNNKVESVAASAPLGSTGGKSPVISITQATTSSNGYLSSTDWNTFNGKQNALSGTGFVKISGTTISYDNSTYVPTSRTLTINGTAYDLSADRSWTISAGISGSGTTNYLPKFTGSTALGNSLIYDDGTNIGIGTTSPSAKLDVNGIFRSIVTSISSTGEISAKILGYPTSPFGLIFRSYSSGATSIQSQREANNSEFFSLSLQPNGGNVGIGTTSPSTILSVEGTNQISHKYNGGGGSSAPLYIGQFDSSGNVSINNAANADLWIGTNNARAMTIKSGGKIGIGTTSPVYKFHVNDTSDGIVGHFSGGVSNYTLISFLSNEPNVYSTSLGSYNSGLLFRTGATDRMYINSSGNVGIGTTSPVNNLHVQNGSTANTTLMIQSWGTEAAGEFSGIRFKSAATANNEYGKGFIGFRNNGTGYGRGDLYFCTNNLIDTSNASTSDAKMIITSSGNVLVGTTSDVAGGVSVLTHLKSSNLTLGLSTDSGASMQPLRFVNGTTAVGSVTTSTTTTSYNIVSDYRLKEDFKNFDALNLISKFKMYDFGWKNSEDRMYGGIAHEIQDVVPYSVTGKKDGDDMQSVDYSKLVPILVQAIQELKAEIEILKTK